MNIIFITIAWPDEGQRNIYSDLIHKFRQEGHTVWVITNRARRKNKHSEYSEENGVNVLRIKTGNIAKTHPVEKCLSLILLGWQFKRGIQKYLDRELFDLILFNTPPITLSKLLKELKEKFNCPLYVLLKDIWPYGFADMGLIKENGWIYNYFRKHEKRLYKTADMIGCMSPKGVDFILDKHPYLKGEKVEVAPNSIQIIEKNFEPSDPVRSKYGIPEDATVFIFSGNLGLGHGLDFFIESIVSLKDYSKAFFLIGGAGTHFDKIKKVVDSKHLPNVHLYSYLPEKEYNELVSVCDVGLILLDNKYSYPQFPSRLLGYLQNKMAVLCAVNRETDIGEIIENHGAGLKTIHGNKIEFIASIKKLCENKGMVKTMGENGYRLLVNKYDVNRSYDIIMRHFEKEGVPL